jgi:hypothetical protein
MRPLPKGKQLQEGNIFGISRDGEYSHIKDSVSAGNDKNSFLVKEI